MSSVDNTAENLVVFQGVLAKQGRGRSLLLSAIRTIPPWTSRTVKLLADKRVQYFDGPLLKGELNIESAVVKDYNTNEIEGKKFPFEVQNFKGESILFNAPTRQDKRMWIRNINAVVNDTWSRDNNLDLISRVLKLENNTFFTLDESNKAELLEALPLKDGAGFEYLFHNKFLGALLVRLKEFAAEMPGFIEHFVNALPAQQIRFALVETLPSYINSDGETRPGLFRSIITADSGVLVIQFIMQTMYATSDLAADLHSVLTNNMRDVHLRSMDTFLGIGTNNNNNSNISNNHSNIKSDSGNSTAAAAGGGMGGMGGVGGVESGTTCLTLCEENKDELTEELAVNAAYIVIDDNNDNNNNNGDNEKATATATDKNTTASAAATLLAADKLKFQRSAFKYEETYYTGMLEALSRRVELLCDTEPQFAERFLRAVTTKRICFVPINGAAMMIANLVTKTGENNDENSSFFRTNILDGELIVEFASGCLAVSAGPDRFNTVGADLVRTLERVEEETAGEC